jgi:rhodanese-related sulfurtransferase/DNA-binding transcriptional ArsR family regulator
MNSPARRFKDAVHGQLARIGRALASPRRLELLGLLCESPRTVEALARLAGLSTASASQHLRALHGARLVETERRGLYVEYRLADERIPGFLRLMSAVAESRLSELRGILDEFVAGRGAMAAVSQAELQRRVRRREVTLIDVRPPEEYRAGHIAGALSLPLPRLRAHLARLPRHRDVVAYCRGRYCLMALEAVDVLRKAGFQAHRLEHGVTDWRARGWKTERTREASLR